MTDVLLSARGLRKSFTQGNSKLEILKGINFQIKAGEAVSIVGESGAGKSTLLHVLSTLEKLEEGEIVFAQQKIHEMSDSEISLFRNQKMGFVFQFHHLMAELTAVENVALPLRILGESVAEATGRAKASLASLGLEARFNHFPSELSGGELQRVSIARALVNQPQIIFADEPTGNLDSENGARIQELFFRLRKERNVALIVVTHDAQFAGKFDRCLRLKDGHFSP